MEKDFRLNKSFDVISSLLKSVWQADQNVNMWQIIGKEQCEVSLKFVVVNIPKKEIVFTFDQKDLIEMNKILAPKVEVNFFVPDEMILFRAQIKDIIIHENRIKVKLPSSISITERRVGPRHLVIDNEQEFKISFSLAKRSMEKQIFTKNCYDLSREGLSFIVNKSELNNYKAQDIIKNVTLHVGEDAYPIALSVLSNIPVEPSQKNGLLYASVKVGAKFGDLSVGSTSSINQLMNHLDEKRDKKA